eukprot:scaffold84980_cov33-Cyclotella_meneghiniana.AAC.2
MSRHFATCHDMSQRHDILYPLSSCRDIRQVTLSQLSRTLRRRLLKLKALSKEHGAFCDFIRALRDAMFVIDPQDMEQCLSVLRDKHGMSDDDIDKKLQYDFAWFLRRIKRKVPDPEELERRYIRVYETFKDIPCAKTGRGLFATKHGKRAHLSALKHIRRNCLSDIPFVSYYYPVGEDKDGLTLYKCIRGTSALEGLHQKLRQLVRGFSSSPRFMKALEIEKMAAWNTQGSPPHPEWVSCNSFQCTGEEFGLIDPISTESNSTEEAELLIEQEADAVADSMLELDTGVTEDDAVRSNLPESSRWLALNFGRWRPSGRVKGNAEWEYFKENISNFQRAAGLVNEADNHSSIQWSAFADHWNNMVARLGTSKPDFTYKTASLLQDAHKTLQRRSRRDTTILPYASDIDDLRNRHATPSSCVRFSNQFVASEKPSRARPNPQMFECLTENQASNADSDDDSEVERNVESPAERERRVYAYSTKKRKRTNAKPRCRMCGKQWNTYPWRDLHRRDATESEVEANDIRPQTRCLRHGQGKQVWDYCRVARCDYEPGFPMLDTSKPLPRLR